jgi:hypothetical protein
MPKAPKKRDVSPDNPCPFLRALVAQGLLADDVEPIGQVADTIVRVARTGDGQPLLPGPAIRAVALVANGLSPAQVARNGLGGLRLNELRNGPLDKKGVGSGILSSDGKVSKAELKRLGEFAVDQVGEDGEVEPGLGAAELKRMMDANFARAEGRRRKVDRAMMDAEWPVLLKVMGKRGRKGRYLSLKDVERLFTERSFPQRMVERLGAGVGKG